MNDSELSCYRIDQLENRMDRIEKFIIGGLLACTTLAGTLVFLIIDLPSRIIKIDGTQHNSQNKS